MMENIFKILSGENKSFNALLHHLEHIQKQSNSISE